MSTQTITINDLGTALQITVQEDGSAVDVSTATVQIELTKPSGTKETKTATFVTDGSNGQIQYVTVSGDIDETGIWSYRGIVTFSGTQVFYTTDPETFTVVA